MRAEERALLSLCARPFPSFKVHFRPFTSLFLWGAFFRIFLMFHTKTIIQLRDTDATGVIYFAALPAIILHALEEALQKAKIPLKDVIELKDFLMPIVRLETDYLELLSVGDEIEITGGASRIGEKSFTLSYEVKRQGSETLAATATFIHVTIDKKSRQSIPLPPEVRQFLAKNSLQK